MKNSILFAIALLSLIMAIVSLVHTLQKPVSQDTVTLSEHTNISPVGEIKTQDTVQ